MFKRLLRRYIGNQAWVKLAQARQEFRIRKKTVWMDQELFQVLNPMLPPTGYYVDVGAHDGRSYSNTFHLEKAGWRGVLIEPILPTYFKLRQIRSKESNIFVNAACVSFSFNKSILPMSYGDLMSFAPDISSVNNEEWRNGAQKFLNCNETIVETWANAKPLNEILKDSNSPKSITFMSIDVEGAELEVLKGINFSEYSFDFICLETYDPQTILNFFQQFNYHKIAYVAFNLILKNSSKK